MSTSIEECRSVECDFCGHTYGYNEMTKVKFREKETDPIVEETCCIHCADWIEDEMNSN